MKYKFIKKVENKVYMFKDLIRDQYVLYDHGDVYVVDDMYITLQEETKTMKTKVSYEQLVEYVHKYALKTQMNVVSFLIGLKGCVDSDDWANLLKLKWNEVVQ